jgi:hypothetical protein
LTPRQKLRTGEIARETGSIRDTSVMQPSSEAVFNTGPCGHSCPFRSAETWPCPVLHLLRKVRPKDPVELLEAQENYKAVFASGAEASPAQKKVALGTVALASRQLSNEGYELFSKAISADVRCGTLRGSNRGGATRGRRACERRPVGLREDALALRVRRRHHPASPRSGHAAPAHAHDYQGGMLTVRSRLHLLIAGHSRVAGGRNNQWS